MGWAEVPYAVNISCWCTNPAGTFTAPDLQCVPHDCTFPRRCIDSTSVPNNGTKCRKGSGGSACIVCDQHWYRSDQDCLPCPTTSVSTIVALAVFGIFVLYIGPKVSAVFDATTRTVLKQVLSHLSLFSINISLGLHWPPVFKKVFHVLRSLVDGIQLAAPECIASGWSYDSYLIILFSRACTSMGRGTFPL